MKQALPPVNPSKKLHVSGGSHMKLGYSYSGSARLSYSCNLS